MKFKEFKPSSWAIDNKISVYVITIFIAIAGLMAYNGLPKENFPDIVVPTIYINTVYVGNTPANIENLVTKPIEKQLKSISGVKKLNSTSLQDVSVIMVEFSTDIEVAVAKAKVKDAVDKAATDLPKDLTQQPNVIEVAFSDMPIMYINIAGNMDLNKLKEHADDLKDKIESMKEISQVVMVGDLEREIQINVDMYKLQAANLSLADIEGAVARENINISGGLVPMDGMKRNISVKAEFKTVEEISNLIVTSGTGVKLYLKDVAEVIDTNKEQESYARLEGKNVITLNVVKRAGENLINASDQIIATIDGMKKTSFPKELVVTITGDQSDQTRSTLHELINTIIIGFILVTCVLMFFMGVTNALFVAVSVPVSMFIAFMILPTIGFTLNMIVLFAFLLALGIVVDDAIVVIENTHRLFENGKRNIVEATKMATGEVFLPVFSGTLTTLAPFVPLAFWPGLMGKFMYYLPITLIITLTASLLVAYIINPVFAVDFMKSEDEERAKYGRITKQAWLRLLLYALVTGISYLSGHYAIGNTVLFFAVFMLFHRFFLYKVFETFQTKTWPAFQNGYTNLLHKFVSNPVKSFVGTLVLLVVSVMFFGASSPKVIFFPQGDPHFAYIYVQLPVGTDPAVTNKVMLQVEAKVNGVLGEKNPVVGSVITNVTKGTSDPQSGDRNDYQNKGKVSIAFVAFDKRGGVSTADILRKLQQLEWNIPGAQINVTKEQSGPPMPKPVNIEVRGDNFEVLVKDAIRLKQYINQLNIDGVEEIETDFENSKPEIVFNIDRERANREGVSTAQLGLEIRKSVFGAEVSKFRDDNDQYPIQLRYQYDQRNNIETIRNLKITFRDMNMGGVLRSVPLSAFCDVQYSNTYGGIKRKKQTRVISLSSNVMEGFNPKEVAAKVEKQLSKFEPSANVEVEMTGAKEEEAETTNFLGKAMGLSFGIILLILVIQFGSIGKPTLILMEILFSIIGVLLGFAFTGMEMSILMTGVGIIALLGIVVRNGILLVEFAEQAREKGATLWDATIDAGRTRMTPVVLTASATILGLIPLAVGLNIDFEKLFSTGNPHIYFGGDSVVMWGPLAWTMIFGLSFATFLTLLIVPVMYLISERLKRKSTLVLEHFGLPMAMMYIPFFVLMCRGILAVQGKEVDYGNLDY
jgi:multidrug efflux pump